MRKFLLILSCLAVMLGARAEEQTATVTFLTNDKDSSTALTATSDLAKIIESGASFFTGITETNSVYSESINGLKFSSSKADGKITFAFAEKVNMTKVVVKASNWINSKAEADEGKLTVNELAAQDLTAELADYTFNVTGEQSSITLAATKRIYVASITFYYDNEGGTVEPGPDDPIDPTPVTVVAPKFNIAGGEYDDNITIELTCDTKDAKIYYTLDGTTPTTASTLYTDPFNINKGDGTVTVNAIAVIASPVATATYTMASDVEYTSLAALFEGEPLPEKTSGKFVVNFKPVVAYINGSNIYAYENGKYVLIYLKDSGLEAGDLIKAGWTGHVENYNNLYEIKPDSALEADGTGEIPEPEEISTYNLTADDASKIVILKNVVFAEATLPAATANFTGKMGETEVTFRNSFKVESVNAGTYDVKAVVTVYKDAVQIYPISYAPASEVSVNEIISNDKNAYYNLQGVKVTNPEAGIFINNNGKKVVIK